MLQYRKILAPIDFAEISNSALKQAAMHSEQSQSELLVAHVVDRMSTVYSADDNPQAEQTLVRQAELHLTDLLDELEIGYADTIVRVGLTVPCLLEIISENGIDLVVMGTHRNHTTAERYKSTTMDVVENANCDVLVLHK